MNLRSFGSLASRNKKTSGYTLMEVAVSISIMIMIMSIAVGYGRGMDRQLALIRAQTQIVAILNHAKGLAQNFLLSPPSGYQVCGYGVHVDNSTGNFQVFQDLAIDLSPTVDDCPTADSIYTSALPGDPERLSGSLNSYKLDLNTFAFNSFYSNGTTSFDLVDVVFIPPDPTVKINLDPSSSIVVEEGWVGVRMKEATASRFDIRVNKFGQITKQ